MSNEKSYSKAAICFCLASVFITFCAVFVFSIVLSPQKFVFMFTLCMLSVLSGLAFMNGPRMYVKKLFISKNLIASSIFVSSIVLSLYFSIVSASYLLSLLFCIIQLNAMVYFFCSTSAVYLNTLKWMGQGCWAFVC